MKRKVTVFMVAVAPTAIALVAAAFVGFASGSPSLPEPCDPSTTASTSKAAADAGAIGTVNSPWRWPSSRGLALSRRLEPAVPSQ
jgi:hypothetical protein